MGYQGRDVEIVFLAAGQCLVAACDSCGAIGSKELDAVQISPYIVGRFTARVALMEVVATGASPQILTAAIANEPEPTGAEILRGIKDELTAFKSEAIPVAISTEKNMPTRQTALGVTVVGLCAEANLKIATSRPGDRLYCLGLPKVGPEIQSPDDRQIVNSNHLQKLLSLPAVHDIIPVGSKGIRAEAELLAANLPGNLILEIDPGIAIDLTKSAGPSTCLIFTIPSSMADLDFGLIPCHRIGRIVSNSNE